VWTLIPNPPDVSSLRTSGAAAVHLSFVRLVDRFLSGSLRERAAPIATILDGILHGRDDRSVSRRIAIITFGVRIISAAIAYFSQILLARWMGDFEYGIFVAVWVGAVLLGGFAGLGIQTAILRFVPEYFERKEVPLLRGVIIGSRVQGFLTATFFAVVGMAGLYFFGHKLAGYYLIPLYLGAVTLPMLAIGEIQDNVARAFNWANLGLWPTFIVRPLLIIVFMWLAIYFGREPDAITAMAATIVATYFTSIGQLIWLSMRVRGIVPAGPRQFAPATWISIALPIFLVEGFFNLLTNIDIILVGRFMPPDQVGIYFAAAKTMALVHFVYYAVRAGGAQRFSQYYAAGDTARLAAFARDTLHWTFWPSLAIVILLIIFGEPLLSLFGPSFSAGYILIPLLSIGILVRASIGPAETLLIMAGQQTISAWIYGATFLIAVSLNVLLIPRMGLVGAAVATSASLVAETIALYVITITRLGLRCSIVDALLPPRGAIEA
jgi:O-antigen/teichoic acid export membrane protein